MGILVHVLHCGVVALLAILGSKATIVLCLYREFPVWFMLFCGELLVWLNYCFLWRIACMTKALQRRIASMANALLGRIASMVNASLYGELSVWLMLYYMENCLYGYTVENCPFNR